MNKLNVIPCSGEVISLTGLQAYYKMNGNVIDSSGNGLNGTSVGTPTYTTGKYGDAISLNGTSQYVTVPDSTLLEGSSGNISVFGWINITDFSSDGNQHLISKYTSFNGWRLVARSSDILVTVGGVNITRGSGVATGTWSHIGFTKTGTTLKVYQNGVQIGSDATVGTTLANSEAMYIGRRNDGVDGFVKGLIDDCSVWNRVLTPTEIGNLYDSTCPLLTGMDSDAQAFLTAASITDPTISEAIDTFVIGMKSNSLWTKFYAIYPMVGGTATTHKWNLKDPRDLDAAYRITWSGTVTHNSNGVTGDGSTGYGNTYLNDETVMTRNNKAGSVYCRTNSDGGFASYGVQGSGVGHHLYIRLGNDSYNRINDGNNGPTNTNSSGFFIGSRVSSTERIIYRNGTSLGTHGSITQATTLSINHYLLGYNNSGTAVAFSPRNYCYFAFSSGFTPAEASTYNTLVQAMQTTLGRNV